MPEPRLVFESGMIYMLPVYNRVRPRLWKMENRAWSPLDSDDPILVLYWEIFDVELEFAPDVTTWELISKKKKMQRIRDAQAQKNTKD